MYSDFKNLISLLLTPLKNGYPIFILILFVISKTKYKDRFDIKLILDIANFLLLFSGVLFFLYIFYELFHAWYSGNMYETYAFANRNYSSFYLYYILIVVSNLYPIVFIFKKLRENMLCSIIVAIFTVIVLNLEQISTFIISQNPDYLPSKWVHYYTVPEKIFLNPITQTILFSAIVAVIYKLKKTKLNN